MSSKIVAVARKHDGSRGSMRTLREEIERAGQSGGCPGNESELAYFVDEAKGYRLSTPELLRVSGLLLSELLKTQNVADDLLGRILKAIAIDDIPVADFLAILRERDLDVQHQLSKLLRTGRHQA
jgi:hypothetical protein